MSPRTAAPFQSAFAEAWRAFLAYRRDVATFHAHLPVVLRHLDQFLVAHAPGTHTLTPPLVQAWMATLDGRAAITRRNYFRVVRQWCLFQARTEPAAFNPDPLLCPRVRTRFRPYIYSEDEIRGLLRAAARLPGDLRPYTYVMLLLVLYTTGVRLGEALRLELGDVDRDRAVLHVRAGKFRKSRLVPMAPSLRVRLETYFALRRRAGASTRPDAALFWSPRGGPYSHIGVQHGLSQLIRAVCKKPPGRSTGPRVHDLRHAFAVHRCSAGIGRVPTFKPSCPSSLPTSATAASCPRRCI